MKTEIYKLDGKTSGSIDLPKCFSTKVRADIIAKVVEAQKITQPYSPSPIAGNQHSASGIIIHKRKVWKSQYGRGMSRVPRKIMSAKGSQFNWVGAAVPNCRGGRRAHVPKIASMIGRDKINKKELLLALKSAIAASVSKKEIMKKYETIEKIDTLPIVIESAVSKIKVKDLVAGLKNILGEELTKVAFRKKTVRNGKGKMRGRKYKSTAGMLLVVGKEEIVKTNQIEVAPVSSLCTTDLAKGGQGRLTLYTENAIKELSEKLK